MHAQLHHQSTSCTQSCRMPTNGNSHGASQRRILLIVSSGHAHTCEVHMQGVRGNLHAHEFCHKGSSPCAELYNQVCSCSPPFTTMIWEFGASSSHPPVASHPMSLIDGQHRACCSSSCPPPRHHSRLQMAQLQTAKCHSDVLATTYQLCKQPVWSDVASEPRALSNHDHTCGSSWGVSPQRDGGIQWRTDQT